MSNPFFIYPGQKSDENENFTSSMPWSEQPAFSFDHSHWHIKVATFFPKTRAITPLWLLPKSSKLQPWGQLEEVEFTKRKQKVYQITGTFPVILDV